MITVTKICGRKEGKLMHQVILGLYSIINRWNFRKDEKEELFVLTGILFAKILITCVFELVALALRHSFSASKPRIPIQNTSELGAVQMFSLMLISVLYRNNYGNLLQCLTVSNASENMGKSFIFFQFIFLRSTFVISNRFYFCARITNLFRLVLRVVSRQPWGYLFYALAVLMFCF